MKASALQRGSARKGWPSFFFAQDSNDYRPGSRTLRARTGLAGLSRQKGWGAPCCQAAARTPRPAGLPLPTRRGWGRACQPLRAVPGPCLLASVARGSAQAPPSFQTAARAAAGRAPAVARAACLASSQPLAGRASPGLDPGPGVCRFASSVLVARGPPYDGGPAHSSACAPVAWHVAPVSRGLRSAPPALAGPYAASRAGPGGLRRGAAPRFPRSSPPFPPCAAACASVNAALGRLFAQRASQPPVAHGAAYSGALPLHPFTPGGHRPPAPKRTRTDF